MDPSTQPFEPGHWSSSNKTPHSRKGSIRLGRRMVKPPPRFLRAPSDILGYTPSHLPRVNTQLAQARQSLDYIPPVQTVVPLGGARADSNYPYMVSPITSCQADHHPVDWITPPQSPVPNMWLREPTPPEFDVYPLPVPTDSHDAHAQPALVPPAESYSSLMHQAPDPVANVFNGLVHPTPRRPILLPEVGVPFRSPTVQLSNSSYMQRSTTFDTQFDQADYSININTIFRKDSRFLKANAKAVIPQNAVADILPPMPLSRSRLVNTNTAEQFAYLNHKLTSISIDPRPQVDISGSDSMLGSYIALMRERFGCCLTYGLVSKVVNTDPQAKPLLSFDERKTEMYKRRVRSWAATATGTTISEMLIISLEPGNYFNNERFTVPYFWFVLLVRELLVNNCYARDSGTLIRLGACDVNPCHSSFRFFALETAMRQHLRELNSKSRINPRETTLQQRVIGSCENNHLQITMSQQLFSNFYSPIPKPRLDRIEYQNELRAWFVKLVNRIDSFSGFTAFVLITFMGLENE